MFIRKSKIQKEFKKQIRAVEKEMLVKEKNNTGAFANKLYKLMFYGYAENNKKRSRQIFNISRNIVVFVCFIFLILSIFDIATPDDNYAEALTAFNDGYYIEAEQYLNKELKRNPVNINSLILSGKTLNALEKYEEAIDVLKSVEKIDKTNIDLYLEMGYANHYLGKYNVSLNNYDNALEIDSNNLEAIIWKAYNQNILGRYDAAIECIDKLLDCDPMNYSALNIKGNALFYKENYKEAITIFETAIPIELNNPEAYINKIKSLFYQKKYTDCINYCEATIQRFPQNSDVLWFMADCFACQNQHKEAIYYYIQASEAAPENTAILTDLGWEYYNMQNFLKSTEAAGKALSIDTENESALYLKYKLDETKKNENERIVDLVKHYYLYKDKVQDFEKKLNDFLLLKQISPSDISDFIDSIKLEDDKYTFMLYDQDYDYFVDSDRTDHIEYKKLQTNINYLRINSFSSNTANEFREVTTKIQDSENQILVIDLRDNPGGLTDSTNNVLDILLPKCITSYQVYNNGNIDTYESDVNQIKFKKIYLFVNNKSASSSELLSLGLKKFLQSTTIIGTPTVGKGVGQTIFENKQNKYIIFLVSHYWNVKEKNITGEKIIPDITVKGSKDEDFINALYKDLGIR